MKEESLRKFPGEKNQDGKGVWSEKKREWSSGVTARGPWDKASGDLRSNSRGEEPPTNLGTVRSCPDLAEFDCCPGRCAGTSTQEESPTWSWDPGFQAYLCIPCCAV